jgi:hypothetical protein
MNNLHSCCSSFIVRCLKETKRRRSFFLNFLQFILFVFKPTEFHALLNNAKATTLSVCRSAICVFTAIFDVYNFAFSTYIVFMFSFISENMPIISLYSISRLVFITQMKCVYCAVRTEFMCFVWISEQTAIISLYSIN